MAKEKVYNLRERTFNFAKRILEISEQIPVTTQTNVIRGQLTRAGTSIGSNMEEADGILTKKDFINKIVIARKEAKETLYWLRLLSGKYLPQETLNCDLTECQELISILSSIILKTH